jgi:GR25 family glycosyltransferase involved in LPS biosynthesis
MFKLNFVKPKQHKITNYSPNVKFTNNIIDNKLNPNIKYNNISTFMNFLDPKNNCEFDYAKEALECNIEGQHVEAEEQHVEAEEQHVEAEEHHVEKESVEEDLINYVKKNINMDYNKNKYIFEKIYIISLKKCLNKRERCINQLLKYNITNYEFFEAIDTINTNFYNCLYEKVTSNYNNEFIQHNYQKGALGCLLSHLNVLKDAKLKGYKSILILEDDFLINNNFIDEYIKAEKSIPENWDFIYFGKKQGKQGIIPNNLKHIYPSNIINVTKINDYVYKPNYFTYATHSLCIKNTIYDALIDRYNTLCAPVDLIIMELYEKYNFYVLYNDLFITSFDSDIRHTNEKKELELWNWDLTKYFNTDKLTIKNIIIWGMDKINHTHHYIHNMYFEFLKYYYNNVNIIWCSNNETYTIDFNYSIFFVSPSHGDYSNLPYNNKSLYIFHLDDFSDNLGLNINTFTTIENYKKIIEENRGIILLAREKITELHYFEKNIIKNTICLPWFSNKKFNDVFKIKSNIQNIFERNKKGEYYSYFGSVWYLNINEIISLINSCNINKNKLIISGRFAKNIFQQVNELQNDIIKFEPFYNANKHLLKVSEDSFERLNDKYSISAFFPIQGSEHNDNYLSNRLLENICEGYIGFSNNFIVNKLFKNVYHNDDISELVKYITELLNNKDEYCNILNKQIDEVLTYYYGYKIIDNLIDFLQKVYLKNSLYFTLNTYDDSKHYKLIFTNTIRPSYTIINNSESLNIVNITKTNYIIKEHLYDVFMLDKIIKYLNYDISIDKNYKYKNLLVNICKKYKKKYIIKQPIKVYCLFSHQRTGSTLIVDYIQKTSKKILALSEIFNTHYTETSYDVKNPNGILYNYDLISLNTNHSNITEFINQFIYIAEDRGYEGIFFKYTYDNINNFDTSKLDLIIENIQKYNIIYLDRNDIDVYISKKLADKNNTYSNEVYKNKLTNEEFNIKDFYKFLNKKNDFLNEYLTKFKKIKYINYNFIKEGNHLHNINYINNLLNCFYNDNTEYLIYEKYYEYYDIFNKKQNKFNNELINYTEY